VCWRESADAARALTAAAPFLAEAKRVVFAGVVEKNGAHLSFGGEHLGQGRERARDSLIRGAVGGALRAAVEAAAPGHRARAAEPATVAA